jgi:hypothetical protein
MEVNDKLHALSLSTEKNLLMNLRAVLGVVGSGRHFPQEVQKIHSSEVSSREKD